MHAKIPSDRLKFGVTYELIQIGSVNWKFVFSKWYVKMMKIQIHRITCYNDKNVLVYLLYKYNINLYGSRDNRI